MLKNTLDKQVAVVFGAGSCGDGWGNGKAAAVAYARSGASVAAVDLNEDAANETRQIIENEGGRCIAIQADVSDSASVKAAVDLVIATYNKIDVLHNNVGICKSGDPVSLSEEDWNLSMNCNVKSVFLSCKHVLPFMLAQGSGVVTNISSILSIRVSQYNEIAYYASKAAVNQLTKAIAVRYAGDGIRANAILPGLIHTPLLYSNKEVVGDCYDNVEQMLADRNAASPTGKMGSAWDIANLAVFLASDTATYINGTEIPVDGGLVCKQA